MAKLIWTEPALTQLEAILDYIALDKPEAAQAVARRILDATDQLETFTRLGRTVPELPHPKYRQVWMKPCWITTGSTAITFTSCMSTVPKNFC